ncbi:MAG: sensor histidine kinase [Nocardioidaceae bacterium]
MAPHPRLRRPNSVRARTTLVATLIVALALTAAATALVLTLQSALERSGDAAARARVHDLASLAESGGLPRVVAAPAEDDVVEVLDAEGDRIAGSPDSPVGGSIARFRPAESSADVRTVHGVADGSERESYRVWAIRASTDEGAVFVYVGSSLEQAAETTALLTLLLATGIPALCALLAVVTWILLGRALAPVEVIRAEVADISGHAPQRRVPVPATDDEVSRLAVTMNDMLERLARAADRQREFVADASHELQSPLASLRTQLEVALAHPQNADWPAVATELLADSDRMESLVRDLLYLARADALPRPAVPSLVDLDDVVLDEISRLRAHTQLLVDASHVSAAPVRGSAEDLRRVVRNLLDNAVRHAATSVHVHLAEAEGRIVLVVEDDGPGVPAPERERVFARFVRLETARSHLTGGTGLGLAIVRSVAQRHQGTVVLAASDQGARFVVELPAVRPDLDHLDADPMHANSEL